MIENIYFAIVPEGRQRVAPDASPGLDRAGSI